MRIVGYILLTIAGLIVAFLVGVAASAGWAESILGSLTAN